MTEGIPLTLKAIARNFKWKMLAGLKRLTGEFQ
ncbi:hypothetical protein HCH_04878 [Hahella chejuensis KCTC 2396]|uniref:Uncharacterized protein n=1 Tax=Hahella chejuensis (strain KCTC 2396) TaxID=349521 RepID=Q2SCQ5_HAHCH|nr:hypothetical protein HCH_04878 [Hahella chejuensis KCTC 2396]